MCTDASENFKFPLWQLMSPNKALDLSVSVYMRIQVTLFRRRLLLYYHCV